MPKNVPLDSNSPVRVLNEGTKEYNEMGMEELMKQMDIPGLFKKFDVSPEDTNKRPGN